MGLPGMPRCVMARSGLFAPSGGLLLVGVLTATLLWLGMPRRGSAWNAIVRWPAASFRALPMRCSRSELTMKIARATSWWRYEANCRASNGSTGRFGTAADQSAALRRRIAAQYLRGKAHRAALNELRCHA